MAAVGGLDPSVLVAPDYQTQMLQAQRRLQLADALRQQAMADTPGNGGAVSWTQGLARALEGLASASAAKRGYADMKGANQAYAAGLSRLFGGGPQTAQGAPPAPPGGPMTSAPQNAPQQAPAQPQSPLDMSVSPSIAATAQGQPVAPPQAASPPPAASPPSQPQGGASYPMSLTGNPSQDIGMYLMNQDEYTKQLIDARAKGAAPTDTEVLMAHAKQLAAQGDYQGAAMLQQQAQKAGYIAPISGRPGGWTIYADGHREYNPTAPAPGAMPVMGPDGKPTGKWTEDPTVAAIQANQAGAVAGAQAGAKAPYDTVQTFNPATGQMEIRPKSDITGGGSLNSYYGHNGGGGHAFAAGPSLGQASAADAYGKGNAQAFLETQGIAKESPQRVQALREMQSLISGPNPLNTGPTAAKLQQMAEEHGLTFLAKDNAFVFNKDAARFVAQSASDLGLNGSDARLGMMANASPNMKMTPQALKTVIPTMIGLEYAKMAKATAASAWASRSPGTNAQFESTWRKAYDPRMFTAYAQGGPQALAKAPANLRQQWLNDYRQLKGMGVDFTQFAQ